MMECEISKFEAKIIPKDRSLKALMASHLIAEKLTDGKSNYSCTERA